MTQRPFVGQREAEALCRSFQPLVHLRPQRLTVVAFRRAPPPLAGCPGRGAASARERHTA
jgi:hypothetical protein